METKELSKEERLEKDRTFLLAVCKFAILAEEKGGKVSNILKEAVNQIELSKNGKIDWR